MSDHLDFLKQICREQEDQMRHMAQNAELQHLGEQHRLGEILVSMERQEEDLLGFDNHSPFPDLMKQELRRQEDMLRHLRQQQEVDDLKSSFLAEDLRIQQQREQEDLRIQQQREQEDLFDRLSDKKW